MCFYDQYRFDCGHWKWGHFRQQCAKEYRIGETCRMKLVMRTVSVKDQCKLCQKIVKKMRERTSALECIARWEKEGPKLRASIDKETEHVRTLNNQICELNRESERRHLAIDDWGMKSPSSNSARNIPTPSMALNSDLSQEVYLELTGNSRENGGKTKSRDDLHDPSLPPETPAYSLQSQKPHYKLFKKSNLVYGLPMTFEGNLGPVTVMAVPDSGSDHNVMSLGLALHLGMRLEWSVAEKTELIFLDGSAVIPTALVHASCRFARTFSFDWKMRRTFLVLPSLIEDLIISASFLDKTATFTMFRNRLVQMSLKTPRTLKICTMGAINRRLTCCIDGEATVALPDSGSDVDVISLAYATKRKFKWENTLQEVVFANGRTKIARGKFVAQLSLGSSARLIKLKEDADADEFADNKRGTGDLIDGEINVQPLSAQNTNRDDTPVQRVINTTFYILDGITVDALIGAKSIESLQVYTHHTQHLTIQTKRDIETLKICRIALSSKIRSNAKSIVTSSRQTRSDGLPRPNLEAQLNEADQQENSRREESSRVASLLTGDAKAAFDHSEQDRRRAFEEYRSSLLRNHAP